MVLGVKVENILIILLELMELLTEEMVVEVREGRGGTGTLGLIGKPYHGRNAGFAAEVPFPSATFGIEDKMEWFRRELQTAGADVWLNTPRRPREASGTSGMTAAMNGAVNFSINDGWIPEFAKHGENCFLVPTADTDLPLTRIDDLDHGNMMDILEREVLPCYYDDQDRWLQIMKAGMM